MLSDFLTEEIFTMGLRVRTRFRSCTKNTYCTNSTWYCSQFLQSEQSEFIWVIRFWTVKHTQFQEPSEVPAFRCSLESGTDPDRLKNLSFFHVFSDLPEGVCLWERRLHRPVETSADGWCSSTEDPSLMIHVWRPMSEHLCAFPCTGSESDWNCSAWHSGEHHEHLGSADGFSCGHH